MTEDDKALVERLREMGEHPCRSELPMGADLREAADRIEALSAQLHTVLDRESETHRRHDAKVEALSAEIARKDEALRMCKRAISGGRDEPRRNVREIVDMHFSDPTFPYISPKQLRAALGETK